MRQIIYADILFILNFCMDFLALFAAGRILSLRISPVRLILAGVLGAIYGVFSFVAESLPIPGAVIHIACSAVLCLIAYKVQFVWGFVKVFLIFYFACFMLGGGIEALNMLAGYVNTGGAGANTGISPGIPLGGVILGGAALTGLAVFAGRMFRRGRQADILTLTIVFDGRSVRLRALSDTGNMLRDPVSGLPVIVIGLGTAARLFDMNRIMLFADGGAGIAGADSAACVRLKFRYVPARSVGGSSLLPAFIPDSTVCRVGGKDVALHAVVAVDASSTGKRDGSGVFDCIMPSVLTDI